MKAFRLLGIVAIVLSLLVATAVRVDAFKGKPPEKEKVTKVAPEKQPKPKKTKTPKPKDTPEPVDPATGKEVICHKPGTPAQKTLSVPESALSGHLGHGDTLGPCLELAPPPAITPPAVTTATVRITICHKPGTPAQKTLVLPESAIPGHLGHGDTLGLCEGSPPVASVARVVTAVLSLFFVFKEFLVLLPL